MQSKRTDHYSLIHGELFIMKNQLMFFFLWIEYFWIVFYILKKYVLPVFAFKELTNLIIIRNSSAVEVQGSPIPDRNKFSHIQFQMIKYEDLKWVSVSIRPHGQFIPTFKHTRPELKAAFGRELT